MEKRVTKEQLEVILGEMERAQKEHSKAKVYYSWEDREVRITYPLPVDFSKHKCILRSEGKNYEGPY